MPAYNFKPQFAEAVASGTKSCTIRPKRKHPTKPGDQLKLYTGMRTKRCRLLREATCTSVQSVRISANGIELDGAKMTAADELALAQADGFTNVAEMLSFFSAVYDGLPIENMELIRWS
ncbi:hypothetical protein [Herpetosiphon sp. NSE202]|uniref:hypothetical protein n=1 Tax=Herpetosiphon sp. NSE202 TaxID=3351349 RepID=UPI0036421E7D